jgi:hypothetical protein
MLSLTAFAGVPTKQQKWADRAINFIKNAAARVTTVECAQGAAATAASLASLVLVQRSFDTYVKLTNQVERPSAIFPLFMLGTTIFALRDTVPYAYGQFKKAFYDELETEDTEDDMEITL